MHLPALVLFAVPSIHRLRKTPSLWLLDTTSSLESCYSRTSPQQFFCIIQFFLCNLSVTSAQGHCYFFPHLKKIPALTSFTFEFCFISLFSLTSKLNRFGNSQCDKCSSILTSLQFALLPSPNHQNCSHQGPYPCL